MASSSESSDEVTPASSRFTWLRMSSIVASRSASDAPCQSLQTASGATEPPSSLPTGSAAASSERSEPESPQPASAIAPAAARIRMRLVTRAVIDLAGERVHVFLDPLGLGSLCELLHLSVSVFPLRRRSRGARARRHVEPGAGSVGRRAALPLTEALEQEHS